LLSSIVSHHILVLLSFTSLHFLFFNDPAPTEIYTLSLHDALPILVIRYRQLLNGLWLAWALDWIVSAYGTKRTRRRRVRFVPYADRKSTRLNSSHVAISYAVFCLKKKKKHDM